MTHWTITEDHRRSMSAFFTDFWALVKAAYEIPQEPQANALYWRTLVLWSDALMKKYNSDPMMCGLVMAFIDGQSERQANIQNDNKNRLSGSDPNGPKPKTEYILTIQ